MTEPLTAHPLQRSTLREAQVLWLRQTASRFAARFARDYNDREDYAQDALVKALRLLQREPNAIERSLRATIKHAMIDKTRRREPIVGLDDSRAYHPEEQLLASLFVDLTINRLSPIHREALALVEEHDGDLALAARAAGTALTSLKSRVRDAYTQAKRLAGREDPPDPRPFPATWAKAVQTIAEAQAA